MSNFTVPIDIDNHAPFIRISVCSRELCYEGWGLVDTGAAKSAMTENVATGLSLRETGKSDVNTAMGSTSVLKYHIDKLVLQNRVEFCNLDIDLFTGYKDGPDFLIGMDIISRGNLAITNYNGRILLSFECPSNGNIDFTKM